MSSFVGYFELSNNIFNLSDKEIKKYYFEAETEKIKMYKGNIIK